MSEIKKPLTKNNSPEPPVKVDNKVTHSFETIKQMTLPEVNELVERLKTEYKIGEAVVAPQSAATANEKKEEKGGNASVKVVAIKETGLKMIEAYRAIMDLINELGEEKVNIVQAKKKAEGGERIILTNIPREKAESVKKQLAEKKVEVEIK